MNMYCIAMTSMLQLRQFLHFKKQICEGNNIDMQYPHPEAHLYLFIENSTNEVKKIGTLELFNVKYMSKYPFNKVFSEIEPTSKRVAFIHYAIPVQLLATYEFYMLYEAFKLLQEQGYQYVLLEANQYELAKLTQFYKLSYRSKFTNDTDENSSYLLYHIEGVLASM